MLEAGISSAELGRRSNIASGTISKIINGGMSITIPMAVALAEGLQADVSSILTGLTNAATPKKAKPVANAQDALAIGIMSIDNKRFTCIKDHRGKIIGKSEIAIGLDLAESSSNLMSYIKESIENALPEGYQDDETLLKEARVNLVMQSFEFEETRKKFKFFAKRHFKEVNILPDWQIAYLAAFGDKPGISLIIDKGVSLSYMDHNILNKVGGWKFPVYDLGGENWIGLETIRHTIEAIEGYIPESQLAKNVIAKFSGKIEKITEVCFKNNRDADIYLSFCDFTLKAYASGDPNAEDIINEGYRLIERSINLVDRKCGNKFPITLNGSLAALYRPFLPEDRLEKKSTSTVDKVELLASLDEAYLKTKKIH